MKDELTKVDIQKMQEEIDYRRLELAPKLREALKTARELGDLSENDEYRTAKRELGKNNSRIRYLQNMIASAVVISSESKDDEIGLFDVVTIYYDEDDEERDIRIVTTLRNDVVNGCISKESPLGQALLGKKVGDTVTVTVNNYSYPVTVRKLVKGEDDPDLPISKY